MNTFIVMFELDPDMISDFTSHFCSKLYYETAEVIMPLSDGEKMSNE